MAGPRTPLLHPQEYFAEQSSAPLRDATIVVGAVAVLSAAGASVLLHEFAATLDVMVEVQNPAHTPEWVCEGPNPLNTTRTGCDPSVPETIERRLGALLLEEYSWLPWATLVVVPLLWLVQGVVLHVGSAMFDAEGEFGRSLAVAGWGMAPSLARLFAVGGFLVYKLRTASIGGTPESAVQALEAVVATVGPASMGGAVVVAVWAGVIRTYGLAELRDVSVSDAAALVVVTTVVGLLFELV
ncbi:YIP1 family protein [Halobaculum sp. P14]|uniref:YIP1 family protein n=1 Tax=Halobaculum sp. P14 TaxID=3421638 RepID=UPI003EB85AB2